MLMSDVLLERVDILLLGYIASPDDVAVFNAASRTAALAILVQYAVVVRANSTATSLFAQGRLGELARLVDDILLWTVWPTMLLVLALALAGPTALRLFGAEFVRGQTAFYILLAAHMIAVFTGPALLLLSMTGHQKAAMWITMSCVVLAAVLNAALIPVAGIEGAAVATATAIVVRGVALATATRRLVGIRTIRLFPLPRSRPGGLER
jgi:O-antigen/teichoic acid export membrane protein